MIPNKENMLYFLKSDIPFLMLTPFTCTLSFFCCCFNKLVFILENSQIHLVFVVPPVGYHIIISYIL